MINIELKVFIKDFKGTIQGLKKIGAVFQGTLSQIDTYYKNNNKRLKIREINHKIFELISYNRPDRPASKISNYQIKKLDKKQFACYKQHLNRTKGESVKVNKKRDLWIYKNTRIHLDKVQGLGKFIEMETVIINPQDFEQLEQEHQEIINLLNLSNFIKIGRSYSDLLLERKFQQKELTPALMKHPKSIPI